MSFSSELRDLELEAFFVRREREMDEKNKILLRVRKYIEDFKINECNGKFFFYHIVSKSIKEFKYLYGEDLDTVYDIDTEEKFEKLKKIMNAFLYMNQSD